MNVSIQQLQEHACQALADLVQSFDKHLEEQIKERSKHLEYVDATEILVAWGNDHMDVLHKHLIEFGVWVPSSVLEKLQGAASQFGSAYYQNKGGHAAHEQNADHSALKANELMHEALEEFRNHLNDKYKLAL